LGNFQLVLTIFEVASIEPAPPGRIGGSGIKAAPGGQTFQAVGASVKLIMSLMYRVPASHIVGGPKWFEADHWDIDAKASRPSSLEDLHLMFQSLLSDEFKLKFHKEMRPGQIYALIVDHSGLKMRPNNSAEDFTVSPISRERSGTITGTRVSLEALCWWLTQRMDGEGRPVVDKTGLKGFYDFTLSYMPEVLSGSDAHEVPPGMADLPELLTALREQLGLKLVTQKGQVEYYIIDSVEPPVTK
jgi:uncharacterized protein (TIGR03435 family)